MTKQLYIAKSGARHAPTLPIDAVTRTFGILGQRGTGKTTTAVVIAEEMAKKGGHVVVLDPVGVWWGITRAGEKAGLKGLVIGGKHGDVPLEETGGELVANFAIERSVPIVVVDMRLMRKGAQLRFMADFLEQLFQENTRPLHVVFEEAHRALAQSTGGQMDPTKGRVLGAGEDLVMLGRSRGLGATLVTQRPAKLNKNVLEQAESLFLHRVAGPNDQKAVKAWIDANGDPAATTEVMRALAKEKVGEAWLYSPGWLGLLEHVRIRQRGTYDSSATPEDEERGEERTARAPVDLDELREAMAETVERQKAKDPNVLKRKIAELEKQLEERPDTEPEIVEKKVPDQEAVDDLRVAIEELDGAIVQGSEVAATAKDAAEEIAARVDDARKASALLVETVEVVEGRTEPSAPTVRPARPVSPAPESGQAGGSVRPSENGDVKLSAAERRVLSVLIHYPHGKPKKQLAAISGYSHGGGSFNNAVGRLRTLGLVSPARVEPITATPEGMTAIEVEPFPRGRELFEHWMRQLGKAERAVLEVLYDAYPEALTNEQIAEASDYAAGGGSFNNALGKLRTLELAQGYGEVRAAEALFE